MFLFLEPCPWGEGDDDGRDIGVVDESITNAVLDGGCDVGSKMAGGCTASKCSATQDEV